MAVVEARIRVHHPCPYCDLSVEFPRTLFLLGCDNRCDVFLVSSPEVEELQRVLSAFRDSFHGSCTVQDGQEAVVVVPDFEWADPPSVTGLARRAGVWALPPALSGPGLTRRVARSIGRWSAPTPSRVPKGTVHNPSLGKGRTSGLRLGSLGSELETSRSSAS